MALRDQTFPPAPEFGIDVIPDLNGKVTIVTGSNTGIGRETIQAPLIKNAKVYMASKDKSKAEKTIAEL